MLRELFPEDQQRRLIEILYIDIAGERVKLGMK